MRFTKLSPAAGFESKHTYPSDEVNEQRERAESERERVWER